MTYRNMDIRELDARFSSVCVCGKRIAKGERIVYYPYIRQAVCLKCGENDLQRMNEVIFDEEVLCNY